MPPRAIHRAQDPLDHPDPPDVRDSRDLRERQCFVEVQSQDIRKSSECVQISQLSVTSSMTSLKDLIHVGRPHHAM